MIRRILLVAVCLALLCACGPSASGGEARPSEPSHAEEAPLPGPTEFVLALSTTASDIIKEGADYFCREFAAITGGTVEAKIIYSAAPDADLLAGRAHAAFLSDSKHLDFNLPLAATAMPFLYTGYQNFTMRANASATLDILGKNLRTEHGFLPLAAYYQGALHLITAFPASGYQQFEGARIAVADNVESMDVFARLSGDFVVADTDGERMALFREGEVSGAEVSLAYLASTELSFAEQTHLSVSYHVLTPLWLLIDTDYYDGLTERQKAELAELCAVLTNQIDDRYLEMDAFYLGALATENLVVTAEMAGVRNRAFNTLSKLSDTASAQKRLARELIEIMRRTA